MTIPIIGITTYRAYNRAGYAQLCLNEAYSISIELAGAVPVLIPLGLPDHKLKSLVDRFDGILFSGGGDVQPSLYHSQMHPKVENVDPDRDRVEIHLVQEVIQKGTPFLGICRGLQVINIGLGGRLFEDILDQRPGSLAHQSSDDLPRDRLAHSVRIESDSRLHQIVNANELKVNSSHHQGIKDLAPELKPNAFAPDGMIEAFELPSHPFGIAVQWHPEWLLAQDAMKALFRAFVLASEAVHLGKP